MGSSAEDEKLEAELVLDCQQGEGGDNVAQKVPR